MAAAMTLAEAQRDLRRAYRGGLHGQLVSAAVWAAGAACMSAGRPGTAMVVMVAGGFFIFPLTVLALRLGGAPRTTPGNPLPFLGMQVAFTVPLLLPVVLTLAHFAPRLLFPSLLLLVGAHYLPFVTLYGTRAWLGLAAAMVAGGWVLGWMVPMDAAIGGWLGAAALVVYAIVGWRLVIAEERALAA